MSKIVQIAGISKADFYMKDELCSAVGMLLDDTGRIIFAVERLEGGIDFVRATIDAVWALDPEIGEFVEDFDDVPEAWKESKTKSSGISYREDQTR